MQDLSHLDYGALPIARQHCGIENRPTVSATPCAALRDCEGPPHERKLAQGPSLFTPLCTWPECSGSERQRANRPEPDHRCSVRRQGSQPLVAPEFSGHLLELQGVHGAPLLLQPVRAGGDPELRRCVFHTPKHSRKLYIYPVFYDVTLLRRQGLRLRRSDLEPPLRGTLRITEMDRAINNSKRNLLRVDLWAAFETSRMRNLASMSDPVLLPTMGDGLLIAGTELQSEGDRIWEHRQIWLCRPTIEPERP